MDSSSRYGFVKAGAGVPLIKVADPLYNADQIIQLMVKADMEKLSVLVLPELCLTGYTCGDLFDQRYLRTRALDGLCYLLQQTVNNQVLTIIGLPLEIEEGLYNCALLIQNGNILGVVPKMYLPNFGEYQESRWFLSGLALSRRQQQIQLLGRQVPFGHLLFESNQFCLGIELCEDMWLPVSPGTILALQGANLLVNPMAGNEGGSKAENRIKMVQRQSARYQSAYLLASAGVGESTTDLVFGGHTLIGENGLLLNSPDAGRFCRQSNLTYSELNIEGLVQLRLRNKSFAQQKGMTLQGETYQRVPIGSRKDGSWTGQDFSRSISPRPFEPADPQALPQYCQEILEIQKAGLAKRLESSGLKKVIIGVSGGLDSTLALIAATQTMQLLGRPSTAVVGISMPGLGTSNRTRNQAQQLITCLGADFREISIRQACQDHFSAIGHDPTQHDVVYENTQARERTQILFDIANGCKGLALGTGDMSEAALGWCTYGGDGLSMYSINHGLPKTVVQQVVRWAAQTLYQDPGKDKNKAKASQVLQAILDTPISPELLPANQEDQIQQKTEAILGPYLVHDFFLYYTLKEGTEPEKLLFLAQQAFGSQFTKADLQGWLKLFYQRFFSQQFKRSATADGPKTLGLSLSPRCGLHMPSDAEGGLWWDRL